MNTKCFCKSILTTLLGCGLLVFGWKAFALGADHPNGKPVNNSSWPAGMADLVNVPNRVHGFFVNDSDVFFFSGGNTNFTNFLQDYSKIGGTVHQHRLILHDGVGEAKSPWSKTGQPCDWKLVGQSNRWQAGELKDYKLEVHLWTGGKIVLEQVTVPPNVEVQQQK